MTKSFPSINKIETFIISQEGDGGDYHRQKQGHWIIDSPISNPMSGYEQYRHSRTSWGIGVLGSLVVTITASDGTQGVATGFGGPPACWLIREHFARFVIGSDPRDTNRIWDQMFRASMFYGRKGITLAAISAVDLAIWDLLGKLRDEPVYKMIGGRTKDKIPFYCTGPLPTETRRMGFWGAKVPLPYSPLDGFDSMRKNLDFLKAHREKVGPDYPIMVDCWMSLNVQYAIEIAKRAIDEGININWWEEVLHPDDFDGHKLLKEALPHVKWTTGEHEYSRYGFRKLIEHRSIDIIQPDVMWMGGLTELLKISAMASAYDIPVIPHGSGPYSYHFVMSQAHSPFCEYIANSPDGKSILPVFGNLFINEPVPHGGSLDVSDEPGFGLTLNPQVTLLPSEQFLAPGPERGLGKADEKET
ncbi:MAG: putative racemase [Lentinula lateritia]|uniref:L-rhamnoate dehydratase-like protein n=1 Tax=Lentinula lateritia TaxID=40482 RepID=A0A9W9A5C7_9AGAR|nr:putative racemase [Lentinula edodes]KAJ3932725.1 MAG: putative racemase [Lentinula lateritia]KAJ4473282.1 L-rhamnoate dehydratase-like protein [Lentinula edodes]KAJ4489057.1 L-rhamnoate dehydratase-like protein [Lentinula lateritia]